MIYIHVNFAETKSFCLVSFVEMISCYVVIFVAKFATLISDSVDDGIIL